MGYKDVVVVADAGPDARERFALAAELARRFDAHLIGLCIMAGPAIVGELGYYDPALIDPLLRSIEEQNRSAAESARAGFVETAAGRGLAAEWRLVEGHPTQVATMHARHADLIIVGQVEPGNTEMENIRPHPGELALEAGRPVLVVPYVGSFPTAPTHGLVAWDGSRAAARAVNDAMPLLAAAASVTVLTIDPEDTYAPPNSFAGADIARHLARHGVKAEVASTVSGGIGVGEALLSRAGDLGADLLVMGAYAHSRVRELLLGGATRTVLRSTTLPTLMSH